MANNKEAQAEKVAINMTQRQAILLNASDAGSLLNFRGKLIERLLAIGYDVHVSAPGISAEIRSRLSQLGAHVHEVPLERTGTNLIADLRYAATLRRLIGTVRPLRVINYTIKPNIWGALAARSARVRSASMVTGLGLAFIPGAGLKRRLLQTLMRTLYRFATSCNDRVIFQNPDDIQDFVAAGCLGQPEKAALVNGSGVDLEQFAKAPLPAESVFLMVSRLLISKGVREYAEAAIEVMRRRQDCRFVLVGFFDDGPDVIDRAELNRWVEAGLDYRGPLSDVRPAIVEASVYVLPSYREGTPRSVLEAMAMGRPIITTDVPGCRETVIDGANGLLVPSQDVNALAMAMYQLAGDAGRREKFGATSHDIARQRYDVHKVNEALLEILEL